MSGEERAELDREVGMAAASVEWWKKQELVIYVDKRERITAAKVDLVLALLRRVEAKLDEVVVNAGRGGA